MKKIISLIFSLLVVSVQSTEAIYFRHFLPEHGLAHPAVLSICSDSLGRIWFGTENGVSIYDGSSLKSIKPGDGTFPITGSGGTEIFDIVCDKTGDVFLRTAEGLCRYDARKEALSIIYSGNISAIFSEKGTLYAIDDNRMLEWKPQKGSMAYIRTLPFRNISHYHTDRLGRVWIAADEGLFCAESGSDYKKIGPDSMIYSIFEDSDGKIWIGSREEGLTCIGADGAVRKYNTSNSYAKGLHSNDVRQITEDRDGNIWFGTFNGLYCYNASSDTFTSFLRSEKEGGLSHSSVYSLYMDDAGVLWVGTYYGGVNYADISRNPFVLYPASEQSDGLSNPVVGHITEDRKGRIWICTEGGGLNMLDKESGEIRQFRSVNFPYFMPHTNLKCINYDKAKDILYIGSTSKGLFSYDIGRNKFRNIVDGEKGNKAMAFINAIERHEDRLFLSTREGIFIHTQESGKDSLFLEMKGANFIPIVSDSRGHLWVGAQESIELYDMANLRHLRSYTLKKAGEAPYRPLRIFCLGNGELYASTYGHGIFRLDRASDSFVPFIDNNSSLLNSYGFRMEESSSGHIIVLGEKGINIFSSSGKLLHSYLIGKNNPLTAVVRDCGLTIGKDGTIYVGGTNGMMTFREEDFPERDRDEIYFSKLYINGKLILPGDKSGILSESLPYSSDISLPYNIDRFGVKFASKSNLSDFNDTDYEYHLEGYDEKWYASSAEMIMYTNLRPGKYTLEIRKRDGSDKISSSLKIRVKTPWYVTWWAILLYMSVIASIVYFIVHNASVKAAAEEQIRRERLERERLMEINEAKLRFFTSVSHEFKTPLTIMTGQLDIILQSYKLAPSIYNMLLKVMQQAKNLGRLISDLIEFRKFEQDKITLHLEECDMNEISESVYDRFSDIAGMNELETGLSLSQDNAKVLVDREQMERVIMNLMSNALKFTPKGGRVELEVRSDENSVYIYIKDSGKGIKAEDLDKIFERFFKSDEGNIQGSGIGLSLVKEMVELHHGSISVESRAGEGSTFTIILKKGRSHFHGDNKVVIEDRQETRSEDVDRHYYASKDEEAQEARALGEEAKSDTVLIVEDNKELLEILKALFSPIYRVLTSDNGKDALEIVKTSRPSLVLSDIMMPLMNGTELCSAIKNDIDLCHIPVVLLTALDMPEQELIGILQGADDYMGKPFDSKLLLARCSNIIRGRRNLLRQIGENPIRDISMLATNKLDKEFLDKLSLIIEEEISDTNLNNDVIASKMNMSRASFYNKFKNLTGETPNEYINNIRLAKATQMLIADAGLSIAEISDSLGFNSPNYFSRKFKDKFGMSPAAYRQKKTSS